MGWVDGGWKRGTAHGESPLLRLPDCLRLLVCLSVCMSVCLSVCLLCLPGFLPAGLSVYHTAERYVTACVHAVLSLTTLLAALLPLAVAPKRVSPAPNVVYHGLALCIGPVALWAEPSMAGGRTRSKR